MSPRMGLSEAAVRAKGPGPAIPSYSSIRQSPSIHSPSSSLMESNRSRTFSLPAMNGVAMESSVPGLRSDVFDATQPLNDSTPLSHQHHNPPSLIGGASHLLPNTGLHDQRNRASTWSGDDDIFLFGNAPSATLSEDLASILKLSGAEDKS